MAGIRPGTSSLSRLTVFFAVSRETIVAVIEKVFSFPVDGMLVCAGFEQATIARTKGVAIEMRFIHSSFAARSCRGVVIYFETSERCRFGVPNLGLPLPAVIDRSVDHHFH